MRPDDNDPDKIVLDNQNKYRKVLQTEMPANPEKWFSPKESQGILDQAARPTSKKYQRGLRRWKDLPVPIDVSMFICYCLYKGALPFVQSSVF